MICCGISFVGNGIVGVILRNALSAQILFKERLTRVQIAGLLLAVLALCLISNIAQIFLLR